MIDRLPVAERFTHFFDKTGELRQLDYLLVSTSLAAQSGATPILIRKGLSTKATQVTEPRFPGVTAKNEASDHCPFGIDVTL